MKRLLAILALSACVPFSGSNVPTDRNYLIPHATIAAMQDTSCLQDWATGEPSYDIARAKELAGDAGYRLVDKNPTKFNTTLRRKVLLKKGFWEFDEKRQARTLTHEFVHICQRAAMGDLEFETATLSSLGRLEIETPAYLQTFITMRKQGYAAEVIESEIDKRLVKFRDGYWLHDIDADQYTLEVRQVWMTALDAG